MIGTSGSPPPEDHKAPSRIARRGFAVAGLAVLGVGGIGAARWFNVSAQVQKGDLTAPVALDKAQSGEITLIDIRRPDEWARTGIGAGAVPIDMRSDTFIETLLAQTKGRRDVPVALICARGVRSARLAAQLQEAGFSRVLDVPEGMLGSGAGPGWLKRGLPVFRPK